MDSQAEYIERLRPAGGKRSGKRDLVVSVFLRQEGHLSADDLVDLMREEDKRISRATVYRTLQWMVDAGIARKVDFGEGRFRFEHSYRHPRHFHLICKSCNRSSEFLSSDVEVLLAEIAEARGFLARQSVVQIYGTCEECQKGERASPRPAGATETVFARDALRIAIATERSGLEFYSRGPGWFATPAPARSSRASRTRRRSTCRRSRPATSSCGPTIRTSSRTRPSCTSRGRRTGCSPRGPSGCGRSSTTARR